MWNGIEDLYIQDTGEKLPPSSLNIYTDMNFTKCLFQSPVLNMEYLIKQMFVWFNVTEERLSLEKDILTHVDLLRWDYDVYVKEHPVEKWSIPTSILYGGKDNMQSVDAIQKFVKAHDCKLAISQSSDHPFMQGEDIKIVCAWLEENI